MKENPEFFLKDKNTGKMISAIPHIEGTKEEPKELPCGAGLQRDNVIVTDINMKFGSMVMFMVKWTIASIPAAIILILVGSIIISLAASVIIPSTVMLLP